MPVVIHKITALSSAGQPRPPSRFAVELEINGRLHAYELETYLHESGLRVMTAHPHANWMALYTECRSTAGPANVFRAVIQVPNGEPLTFPLSVPD